MYEIYPIPAVTEYYGEFTEADLLAIGVESTVYIRPCDAAENDGAKYAIYAADGSIIGTHNSYQEAYCILMQNDLEVAPIQ